MGPAPFSNPLPGKKLVLCHTGMDQTEVSWLEKIPGEVRARPPDCRVATGKAGGRR